MAKPNQIPESSMEEILASIRKIISEDESRSVATRPAPGARPEPRPQPNNVSPLFRDQPAEMPSLSEEMALQTREDKTPDPDEANPTPTGQPGSPTVSGERLAAPTTAEPKLPAEQPSAAAEKRLAEPDERRVDAASGALLSPRTNVAVASAFNHLASSILSNNSRTIEQMAEDMMRPMLKSWLDDNLPPLVERLVREEIERVSRRR